MIDLLRTFTPRNEIILEEVPAPQKLAAYSFAFTADISNGSLGDAEDEVASGRFVILHEPGGQDTWEGDFRCVTFMRADVDSEMQEDPLLPEVGWNWLLDSLNGTGATYNFDDVKRISCRLFWRKEIDATLSRLVTPMRLRSSARLPLRQTYVAQTI